MQCCRLLGVTDARVSPGAYEDLGFLNAEVVEAAQLSGGDADNRVF